MKTSRRNQRWAMLLHLPRVAVIVHSILVAAVAVVVALSSSSEIAAIWVGFMVIDFPLSILAIPIELFTVPIIHDQLPRGAWSVAQYVCLPALTFCILGGVQYYLLARMFRHHTQSRKTKTVQLINSVEPRESDGSGGGSGFVGPRGGGNESR